MTTATNKNLHRKYRLKNPKAWGLNPKNEYFAEETDKGFSVTLKKSMWIGLPKHLVVRNPKIFEFIEDGPENGK